MNDDLLKKSILFKSMTDPERDECLLTLNAHRKSCKKVDAILHAGDLTDSDGNGNTIDRQQLGDYLNLKRTNMFKELTRMRIEGIIECRNSHFKLPRTEE